MQLKQLSMDFGAIITCLRHIAMLLRGWTLPGRASQVMRSLAIDLIVWLCHDILSFAENTWRECLGRFLERDGLE